MPLQTYAEYGGRINPGANALAGFELGSGIAQNKQKMNLMAQEEQNRSAERQSALALQERGVDAQETLASLAEKKYTVEEQKRMRKMIADRLAGLPKNSKQRKDMILPVGHLLVTDIAREFGEKEAEFAAGFVQKLHDDLQNPETEAQANMLMDAYVNSSIGAGKLADIEAKGKGKSGMSTLGKLIEERDAIAAQDPNDPRISDYNNAIEKQTTSKEQTDTSAERLKATELQRMRTYISKLWGASEFASMDEETSTKVTETTRKARTMMEEDGLDMDTAMGEAYTYVRKKYAAKDVPAAEGGSKDTAATSIKELYAIGVREDEARGVLMGKGWEGKDIEKIMKKAGPPPAAETKTPKASGMGVSEMTDEQIMKELGLK